MSYKRPTTLGMLTTVAVCFV